MLKRAGVWGYQTLPFFKYAIIRINNRSFIWVCIRKLGFIIAEYLESILYFRPVCNIGLVFTEVEKLLASPI
jgi:hypothetical protein